jgi:hypothetical protein
MVKATKKESVAASEKLAAITTSRSAPRTRETSVPSATTPALRTTLLAFVGAASGGAAWGRGSLTRGLSGALVILATKRQSIAAPGAARAIAGRR